MLYFSWSILINFENKLFKKYWGVRVLKFGKWIKLHSIQYISITKTIFCQTLASRGTSSTYTEIKYNVNIITYKNNNIFISLSDKKKALKNAKAISKGLNLKILDTVTN